MGLELGARKTRKSEARFVNTAGSCWQMSTVQGLNARLNRLNLCKPLVPAGDLTLAPCVAAQPLCRGVHLWARGQVLPFARFGSGLGLRVLRCEFIGRHYRVPTAEINVAAFAAKRSLKAVFRRLSQSTSAKNL